MKNRGAAIICDVAILPKHDKIVLGGKRLTFFENQAASKNVKNTSDEIHAVHVEFNQYYNCFVVLTK